MGGRLMRDSVRVETQADLTTDDWGNTDSGWSTKAAAQRARIIPMGGDEKIRADRLTGMVRFEIVLRSSAANATIEAEDRFVLERASASLPAGAELNIKHRGVDPTGRGRELRFVCEYGGAT